MKLLKKCTCVLLCGGQSLRMRFDLPATNKILAEVASRPLLHHILDHYDSLKKFDKVVLCLGNDIEMISESVNKAESYQNQKWGDTEVVMLDTGTTSTATYRIAQALKHVQGERFFVAYADVLSNVDIDRMVNDHEANDRDVTMTLVKARMPYGRVLLDNENRVYDFIEKPILEDWINAGSFIINRRCMEGVDTNLEFESELLPRMIREGRKLFGHKHNGFWKGVDTYKDLVTLRTEWEGIKSSNHY
ncbi:MAG: Glucose-phosphate cytidylyltransferase [Bacteroidota bacterium]